MSSSATLDAAETVTVTTPGMSNADFDFMITAAEHFSRRFSDTAPVPSPTAIAHETRTLLEPCETRVSPRTEYSKCTQSGAHWAF